MKPTVIVIRVDENGELDRVCILWNVDNVVIMNLIFCVKDFLESQHD